MTCAIYIRVSQESQALKGHSLEAQEKEGLRICKQNGWSHKLFREAGQSADKETLDNRPELQKILDLADEGKIQHCFVTELDRLSRNPITLAYIKKIFTDNDVKVVTPSQTFDFKDDDDDFISDLLGLLAKRENRIRVKRSKRAVFESVLKGGWFGGIMPFGYKRENKKIIPDPEEKKIYNMMVSWTLDGLGSNTIARKLEELNISTKATGRWKKITIKDKSKKTISRTDNPKFQWKAGVVWRILTNPLYKGKFEYKGHKVGSPALISKEEWLRLQEAVKSHNHSKGGKKVKYFYLLKGLLECGRCGRHLYGKIKPLKGERAYCCLSKRPDPHPRFCGLKNINIDKANRIVWEAVKDTAKNHSRLGEAIKKEHEGFFVDDVEFKGNIEQYEAAIRQKDMMINNLLEDRARGKIKSEYIDRNIHRFDQEKQNLIRQREELIQKLSDLSQAKANMNKLGKYLAKINKRIDSFTEQEKYDFLHNFVSRIIISYNEATKDHDFDIKVIIPFKEPIQVNPPTTSLSHRWRWQRGWIEVSLITKGG